MTMHDFHKRDLRKGFMCAVIVKMRTTRDLSLAMNFAIASDENFLKLPSGLVVSQKPKASRPEARCSGASLQG